MSTHCKLVTLILALTLGGQVQTGDIIGGQEAVAHSRPYMVLLERKMQDNTKGHCGGFLLNEDFVMTAAHCQAKSYVASLGVHNVHHKSNIHDIHVEQAFPHKDYDPTTYTNDIMLLKLSHKAKFNKNVGCIALADRGDGCLPRSCTVSGWGKIEKNVTFMSVVLMEVNVTLTEPCQKKNSYCSKGETGPAEGDSGGPLVCENGIAYGVVSSRTGNDGDTQIYSYAKIPDYTEWIYSTMKNA